MHRDGQRSSFLSGRIKCEDDLNESASNSRVGIKRGLRSSNDFEDENYDDYYDDCDDNEDEDGDGEDEDASSGPPNYGFPAKNYPEFDSNSIEDKSMNFDAFQSNHLTNNYKSLSSSSSSTSSSSSAKPVTPAKKSLKLELKTETRLSPEIKPNQVNKPKSKSIIEPEKIVNSPSKKSTTLTKNDKNEKRDDSEKKSKAKKSKTTHLSSPAVNTNSGFDQATGTDLISTNHQQNFNHPFYPNLNYSNQIDPSNFTSNTYNSNYHHRHHHHHHSHPNDHQNQADNNYYTLQPSHFVSQHYNTNNTSAGYNGHHPQYPANNSFVYNHQISNNFVETNGYYNEHSASASSSSSSSSTIDFPLTTSNPNYAAVAAAAAVVAATTSNPGIYPALSNSNFKTSFYNTQTDPASFYYPGNQAYNSNFNSYYLASSSSSPSSATISPLSDSTASNPTTTSTPNSNKPPNILQSINMNKKVPPSPVDGSSPSLLIQEDSAVITTKLKSSKIDEVNMEVKHLKKFKNDHENNLDKNGTEMVPGETCVTKPAVYSLNLSENFQAPAYYEHLNQSSFYLKKNKINYDSESGNGFYEETNKEQQFNPHTTFGSSNTLTNENENGSSLGYATSETILNSNNYYYANSGSDASSSGLSASSSSSLNHKEAENTGSNSDYYHFHHHHHHHTHQPNPGYLIIN